MVIILCIFLFSLEWGQLVGWLSHTVAVGAKLWSLLIIVSVVFFLGNTSVHST